VKPKGKDNTQGLEGGSLLALVATSPVAARWSPHEMVDFSVALLQVSRTQTKWHAQKMPVTRPAVVDQATSGAPSGEHPASYWAAGGQQWTNAESRHAPASPFPLRATPERGAQPFLGIKNSRSMIASAIAPLQ
jgi:hypothetical protein